MSWILIVEQSLNGLQFGLMLFLLAAGLTLVFGIMDMINLAHGSLYMLGAFLAATLVHATGSFALGVLLAIPATAVLGMLLEMSVLRTRVQPRNGARDGGQHPPALHAAVRRGRRPVRRRGRAARAPLRSAGRDGREHPHPRLRRHRHRRHRLDPRSLGRIAAGWNRRHDRARLFTPTVRNILSAAGRERRRAGDRFGAGLPADGRGPVYQTAGTVPCARVGRCAAPRPGSFLHSLSFFPWRCRRSTRPTT